MTILFLKAFYLDLGDLNGHNSDIDQDLQLIEAYKTTGDLEVLGKLFGQYTHLVYGVCLKYLKHRENAQDAVMQIFEELITKLPKNEVQNFKSWLHVVTKNHCLMELRSAKSKTIEVDFSTINMEIASNAHPTSETDIEENIVKLEKCIEKLKNEQKACVKLFYLEKKCYQEITDITSFSIKKVKSYIQNGKRNLKQCIEQSE